MSRYEFGGMSLDLVTAPIGADRALKVSAATLTFFTEEAGGTQITDLLYGGSSVSAIEVPRNGQIPRFQGPDGVTTLWASANGGDRVQLVPLGAIIDAAAASIAVGTTNDTVIAGRVADSASATVTELAKRYTPVASTARHPLTGWFHADGFGAKADGSTDDTAAVQAAIDAAEAAGGGVVFLRKGRYKISSLTMKSNVSLWTGHGMFSYNFPQPVTLEGIDPTKAVIDSPTTNIKGWSIEGLTILGTGSLSNYPTRGIYLRSASFGAIRRVMVQNIKQQGIWHGAGIAPTVSDVLILNACADTQTEPVGALQANGTDGYITRVEAGCGMTGTKSSNDRFKKAFLFGGPGGNAALGNGYTVSHCVGEHADAAFTIYGRHNAFTACRADLSAGHGWELLAAPSGGGNTLASCKGWDNGRDTTATYSGFYVTSLGNTFAACTSQVTGNNASQKYAFCDESAPVVLRDRNEYSACTGDYTAARFKTGGVEADTPWPAQSVTITSGTYNPPIGTRFLDVEVCGGGGGGGGGGSALSSGGITNQVGGGGGAAAAPIRQMVAATTLTLTGGGGGAGGTAGAANGGAGGAGGNGQSMVVTGTGVSITAQGGRGGAGGGANSATTVGGGVYGAPAVTTFNQGLGIGGFASSGTGVAGGHNVLAAGGAGAAGAPAASGSGGNGGAAGTKNTGGAQTSGTTGTTSGGAGSACTAGGGGGGGGGGAAGGGTGGAGGSGAAGYLVVRPIF